MMYFVSDFINISKYRAMYVQLIAMEIIEGQKLFCIACCKTDYQYWTSCCRHAV